MFFKPSLKADPKGNFGTLHGSIGWGLLFLNLHVALSVMAVYFLYEGPALYIISAFILWCLPLFAVMLAGRETTGFGHGMIVTIIRWLLLFGIYAEVG